MQYTRPAAKICSEAAVEEKQEKREKKSAKKKKHSKMIFHSSN